MSQILDKIFAAIAKNLTLKTVLAYLLGVGTCFGGLQFIPNGGKLERTMCANTLAAVIQDNSEKILICEKARATAEAKLYVMNGGH